LFPFVELDLLNVDWKLTNRAVLYIENSVMSWAIDPNLYGSTTTSNDKTFFSIPVREWFPVWFIQQNYINSVIFFTVIACGIGWLIAGISKLIKHKINFFRKHGIEIVLAITILAGIVLWFTKGPAFRYGYAYLLFLCMISISRFVYYFVKEYHSAYTGTFILAYIFYALVYYGVYMHEPFLKTFFKNAPAIVSPEYVRHDLGEGKHINVVEEPACGNAPLPSSARYVYEFLKPAYRGKTIEEGFINQRPPEEYEIGK
jgi:hypothetical protein